MKDRILIRYPGFCNYQVTLETMKQFTQQRNQDTPDEIWCLQHSPVYTLGMAGKEEHILNAGNIPIIKTDRGGQVTYHGPGQLVVYLLIDLARRNLTVKGFVSKLEQAMINMLAELDIIAERRAGAPGVYVENKKIAALGIRVKRGCSYHGLALNVDMDLSPYKNINPCGYPGLQVTQLSKEGSKLDIEQVFSRLLPHLLSGLGYENYDLVKEFGEIANAQKYQAA